jgi:hypothetical protein
LQKCAATGTPSERRWAATAAAATLLPLQAGPYSASAWARPWRWRWQWQIAGQEEGKRKAMAGRLCPAVAAVEGAHLI